MSPKEPPNLQQISTNITQLVHYFCPTNKGSVHYIRPTSTRYHQFFRLERGSFSIEFNPALAGQMTVLETKSELYYYEKYSGNLGGNRPLYLGQVTVNGNDLVNEEYNNNVLENRWYKIAEGVTPIAISRSVADLYGIYNNLNTRPNSYPTLGPDGRVVVKVTVVIRENRTGNKITHVRTYIPKFSANCMNIQTVYYN